MLKTMFLFGSLIPGIVYIIWTCGILIVAHHNMITSNVQVVDLIKELSNIAKWPIVQLLV